MSGSGLTIPSVEELELAHKRFLELEPRDIVYRVCTELRERGRLIEGIMLLLLVWNRQYFWYHSATEQFVASIEQVLQANASLVGDVEKRMISSVRDADRQSVELLFDDLIAIKGIGPTATAKMMHLLAPEFFPLWDETIAKNYQCRRNPDGYWEFMLITKKQYEYVEADWPLDDVRILKALDEYNFVNTR